MYKSAFQYNIEKLDREDIRFYNNDSEGNFKSYNLTIQKLCKQVAQCLNKKINDNIKIMIKCEKYTLESGTSLYIDDQIKTDTHRVGFKCYTCVYYAQVPPPKINMYTEFYNKYGCLCFNDFTNWDTYYPKKNDIIMYDTNTYNKNNEVYNGTLQNHDIEKYTIYIQDIG